MRNKTGQAVRHLNSTNCKRKKKGGGGGGGGGTFFFFFLLYSLVGFFLKKMGEGGTQK